MQSASSRIWTRFAVSISNDDNHYTTGTSILIIFNNVSSPFFVNCLSLMSSWSLMTFWIVLLMISAGFQSRFYDDNHGHLRLALILTLEWWVLSKTASSNISFESLVWLALGLNADLSDHWQTLSSLGQWPGNNDIYWEWKMNSCVIFYHYKTM